MTLLFLSELKRRRVVRALVAYGLVSFAVLQIVEPVMHGLHWSDAVLSYVVVALAIGFPVVVGLAWIFDVSTGAIVRTTGSTGHIAGARLALMLFAIGILAAAPGLLWYFAIRGIGRSPRSGATLPADPSVAVLPFADMSAEKDQEYFADGIAEEILNGLAQSEGLRVIGRTSSFSFKGKGEDLHTIGEKLHVATILEGSVRKFGRRVRITAQLTEAAGGSHLWSETYERELSDVFAVQDDIATAVVKSLKGQLVPTRTSSIEAHRNANPEVYNQYLLGRQLFSRGSQDAVQRAASAYQRSLLLDPSYAPAWAGLAHALGMLSDDAPTQSGIRDMQRKAIGAAERAVTLDSNLAEAYAARAYVRENFVWDWEGAHRDAERALQLNPGDARNQRAAAYITETVGSLQEAITTMRKAAALDPLDSRTWVSLGRMYIFNSQFDLAHDALRHAREISPENPFVLVFEAVLLMYEGHPQEALPLFQALPQNSIWSLYGTAWVEHRLGHTAQAQQALEKLIRDFGHSAAYQVALVFAARGDADRTFEWLDRAYAQRDPGLSTVKLALPLRAVHSDPRFAAFLRRMHLPLD